MQDIISLMRPLGTEAASASGAHNSESETLLTINFSWHTSVLSALHGRELQGISGPSPIFEWLPMYFLRQSEHNHHSSHIWEALCQ